MRFVIKRHNPFITCVINMDYLKKEPNLCTIVFLRSVCVCACVRTYVRACVHAREDCFNPTARLTLNANDLMYLYALYLCFFLICSRRKSKIYVCCGGNIRTSSSCNLNRLGIR